MNLMVAFKYLFLAEVEKRTGREHQLSPPSSLFLWPHIFLTFSFGFVEKGGNAFTSALTWDLGIWGMCGLRIYLKKGRVEVGHFEDALQSGNAGLIPNLFNELC